MPDRTSLEIDDALWERVFVVSPLVRVGTREPDGGHDFAPRHRVVTLPSQFALVDRSAGFPFPKDFRRG